MSAFSHNLLSITFMAVFSRDFSIACTLSPHHFKKHFFHVTCFLEQRDHVLIMDVFITYLLGSGGAHYVCRPLCIQTLPWAGFTCSRFSVEVLLRECSHVACFLQWRKSASKANPHISCFDTRA